VHDSFDKVFEVGIAGLKNDRRCFEPGVHAGRIGRGEEGAGVLVSKLAANFAVVAGVRAGKGTVETVGRLAAAVVVPCSRGEWAGRRIGVFLAVGRVAGLTMGEAVLEKSLGVGRSRLGRREHCRMAADIVGVEVPAKGARWVGSLVTVVDTLVEGE